MSIFIQTRGPMVTERVHITRIVPGALLIGAGAALATEVVAWLAVGVFEISPSFVPLAPGSTALATLAAALLAALLFLPLERWSEHAERTFVRISLVVLAASFIPLVLMALNPSLLPGTTPAAIASLAVVHLVAYGVIMVGLVCTARAIEEGL